MYEMLILVDGSFALQTKKKGYICRIINAIFIDNGCECKSIYGASKDPKRQ